MAQPQSIQPVTYDPIQQLPYDVWIECIKFAVVDDPVGPLPYLAVSPEWSRNLMEEPSLWTTIVIYNGEDEAARIHIFLHLSQNYLLDVVNRASGNRLLAILEANAPRIRSIELKMWSWMDEEGAIFDTKYSLPNLQVLDAGDRTIPSGFILRCPKLTTIFAFVDIENHHLLNHATQDVKFTGTKYDKVQEISPNSKYRSLGINSNRGFPIDIADFRPSLSRWSGILECLSTRLSASLESLSISISSKLLPALILHAPLLLRLQTLELGVLLVHNDILEPNQAIFAEGIPQIRSAHIHFITIGLYAQPSEAFDTILEAFDKVRFFRNLEEIYISSKHAKASNSQLGSCFQSAINARTITIDVNLHHKAPKKPISKSSPMTKLESLTINCLPILDYINASLPISLKLMPGDKSGTASKKKFEFQVDRCDDYNMLEWLDPVNQTELLHDCHTIIFRESFRPHSLMTFSELTDVDLSGNRRERQRGTSGFLSAILQNPEIFPRLHTIRMDGYPFWELLFALMRKRLAGNGIPIKRLVLPSLPCAYILSHLIRLLKGDPVYTARDTDVVIFQRHSNSAL